MRAVYGAGVFDYCLDRGIRFDYGIGVSAGGANIISYLAGQRGRNYRFYTEYSLRKEYMGVGRFLKTGNYIDLDYIYGTLTNSDGEDPLDYDAVMNSDIDMCIVATDAESGEAVYYAKKDYKRDDYGMIKGSCCVPIADRPYRYRGRLLYDGGLSDPIPLEKALASVGTDGTVLGEELRRIGYAGTVEPGFLKPCAFVELHIEQGPILDAEGISIGAVENLQGISWQRVTIEGEQNHAGTTPTAYRVDAGLAAAKGITFLRRRFELPDSCTVATTGCITFEPNAINVIPSRAVFTVDVRNPDAQQLCAEEQVLADYLAELERTDRVKITAERLSRFDPVLFDEGIVRLIEGSAAARGLSCRRMTSGAGQDAQMLARICPTAMIFVPSVRGVSHNPLELTRDADLAAGANIFLDVVAQLAAKE